MSLRIWLFYVKWSEKPSLIKIFSIWVLQEIRETKCLWIPEESILGRGKNKGKNPEVGACSSYMTNSKTSGIMDAQSRREW